MAPKLVYCTLNARRRTALSAIGRFYAQRAFGLPMADRSSAMHKIVEFYVKYDLARSPCPSLGTPIQPLPQLLPNFQIRTPALEDQCRSRIPETALMKSQTRLQKISAGISLVILSLGFSSLGLLSFVNKPHADLANIPQVGTASCIAGTAASLLAGTTFLVASCVYWRRYSQWPV